MEKYTYKNNQKLEAIRIQANERYGVNAEFAYPTQDRQFAILTLDDAIAICGKYMADTTTEALWPMLDKFHKTAEILKARGEALSEAARSLGRASLERYQ